MTERDEEQLQETQGQEEQPMYEVGSAYDAYLKAQKITWKDVMKHMTGPVVSIVAHIIFIGLLGTAVVFKAPAERKDFTAEMTEMAIKPMDKMPEQLETLEEVSDNLAVEIERPEVNTNVKVSVDTGSGMSVSAMNLNLSMPDLSGVAASGSALKIAGVYESRMTTEGRKSAIKKYKGDPETEQSVLKGLDYLMSAQNPDGSWGVYDGTKYQLTALATLAFLAHGETPMSEKYGPAVTNALKIMIKWSENFGNYLGSGYSYSHPVVAYALAEAYGITKMPKLKDAMERMMKPVIENINFVGSYGYWYDKRPRIGSRDNMTGRLHKGEIPMPPCDLSFAGWNYQALKAAYSAGCENPKLQEAIDSAVKGLKQIHAYKGDGSKKDKPGGFGIGNNSKPDVGMTCVGLLCLGLLGESSSPEAKKAMDWLNENYRQGIQNCSWKFNNESFKEYPKAFTHAIYTWYYQTQVLFQITKGAKSEWYKWNDSFSVALRKEQEADGSWSTPAEKYGQAIDSTKYNAEWSKTVELKDIKDLKTYATSLCTLTLEIYYRYLPTTKLAKLQVKDPTKDEDDDVLKIKID